MDLSQLSRLLEEHTAELTSLYESLGAPAETVPAKLSELHAALVGTVTAQREAAAAEVSEVKERVNGLRSTLERKRRRLGESRTSSAHEHQGETLLELRERLEREDVTTERVLQAREKLFTEARKKLGSYVEELGAETVYAGISEQEAASDEDLSLARLSLLEKEATRCGNELKHRQEQLQVLIHEIFELWGELGISPSSSTNITTQSASEEHALDLAILHHLGASITSTSKIEPLTAKLETLQALQSKKIGLETTRDARMSEIQTLYDELYLLWTRLGVSDEEADDFVELWKGCEEKCIEAYKAELARMLQVKADNMIIFIGKEREEIMALWDELFFSDEERANFPLMESDMATEEVLLAHEMEKQRLQEDKASKQPVLTRLAKYFEILDEIAQLEASANDPGRLTGKGQRGDPGRLLREEKLRKRIAKEKPKLERDLLSLIPQWEQEWNQPFLVHGSRFVEDLSARLEADSGGRGVPRSRPPSRAGAATPASAIKAQPTGGTSTAKRQAGASVNQASTAAPSTASKRPRTATLSAGNSVQPLPASYQRPMHTGSSTFSAASSLAGGPVTPCPTSFGGQSSARGQGLLQTQPSTSSSGLPRMNAVRDLGASSRLPLKAQHTGHTNAHSNASGLYNGIGLGHRTQTAGSNSLFSPPALAALQNRPSAMPGKASFRPRPSIASIATTTSSQGSLTSWAGMRVASSTTSIDSGY